VGRDIADMMIGRFEDESIGGFFDLPKDEQTLGLLQIKRKPVEDSPSSSANALALRVLQALALITDDSIYQQSLLRGLNILIHQNGQYGLFVNALATVAHYRLHPPLKLEVIGNRNDLRITARDVFYPGKVLHYHIGAAAEVRICVGSRCLSPAKTPFELAEAIKSLVVPSVGCLPVSVT
jgi:uncharacterized protein YyaL (SSP411 family)